VAADVALFLFAFLSLFPGMMGGVLLLASRAKPGRHSIPVTRKLRSYLSGQFRMSEE
jgi:hypothetical protein